MFWPQSPEILPAHPSADYSAAVVHIMPAGMSRARMDRGDASPVILLDTNHVSVLIGYFSGQRELISSTVRSART